MMTPEDKALEARCRRALARQHCELSRVHATSRRRNAGTYSITLAMPSGRTRKLCAGLTLAEVEEAATVGALRYSKVLAERRADERAQAELEQRAQQATEDARVARIERDSMAHRLKAFEQQHAELEQRRGWRSRRKAS